MRIRCPHCHQPIELVQNDLAAEVICSSCGSHFSLISGDSATQDYIATHRTIGQFKLLERVGMGKFGAVWKARDTQLDRIVAIKVPRKDQLSSAETEKFFREARTAAQLNHPNIVSVHEVGRDGDSIYIVSDFVLGANLHEWLTAQRLTPREAAELCAKISDAVAHAHAAGVVHRDLKPGNIMLDADGQPHITDFGLAKREAGEITMTLDGAILGTPAYMSPEQARGEAHSADARSDVYSLGVILFELVTGELPFRGETRMLMVQILHDEPPSPRKLNARVPRDLETICLKCLEKDPKRRYATACDLAEELRRYLAGKPIRARAVGRVERAWRWCRRNPALAAVGLVTAMLVLFAVGFLLVSGERNRANAAAEEAKRQREIADYERYVATIGLAAAKIDENSFDTAEQLLNGSPAVYRNWEWGRLRYLTDHSVQNFVPPIAAAPADVGANVLSNEGFAMDQVDTTIARLQLTGARLTNSAPNAPAKPDPSNVGAIVPRAVSDDKSSVTDERVIALRLVSPSEENPRGLVLTDSKDLLVLIGSKRAFPMSDNDLNDLPGLFKKLPDGRYQIYLSEEGHFRLVIDVVVRQGRAVDPSDNASGRDRPLITAKAPDHVAANILPKNEKSNGRINAPIESVAFSRDGERFVSGSWDGKARIWDVRTGKVLLTISYGSLYVNAVAFSPDGEYVALGGNDSTGQVQIFNAKTGAPVRKLVGHTDDVSSLVFSRDGRRLLTASWDKRARLYDVESGKLLKEYFGHTWWVWSAAFSHDETRIVTASHDGTVIVWNAESGQPNPPFTGHIGPVYTAAFSPDGQYVVSGGADNRVLVWRPDDVQEFDYSGAIAADKDAYVRETDPKTKQTTRRRAIAPPKFREFEGHTAPIRAVEFSPNGKMVLSAGNDNTVKLWSFMGDAAGETADGKAAAGKLVKSLRGHASWVRSAVFSPDGHSVLSGGHDAKAKLWSIAGYEEVRVFQERVLQGHTDAILSAAFSKDGRRVVTAGRDRTARTWDFSNGTPLKTFEEGHVYLATTTVFFPGGKKLLTAAADNTTRVWDLTTGTQSLRLEKKTGRAAVAAISTDGSLIATGGDDNTAKLWNAETGELFHETKPLKSEVTAVAFSPDGQFFATGELSGGCTIWSAKTAEPIKTSNFHNRKITAIAFTADGKRVLSASTDSTVGQWDLATGAEPPNLIIQPHASIVAMALVPGRQQAILLGDDHVVSLWDIDSAKLVKNLDDRGGMWDSKERPSQLAVSADGHFALWADYEHHIVRLWDLKADREIPSPAANKAGVPFLTLVSGQVWSAAFSPDGMRFATIGGNSAKIWDVATAGEQMSLTPSGIVAAANFSPDGKWIVTGSWDNSVRIWNAETGKDVLKLSGHGGFVNSACFAPDGLHVLTASDDHTAKLWDFKQGKAIVTFEGHGDRVTSAVLSDDGRYVLTGSADKTARLWDAATGKQLHEYKGHLWGVLAVAFWQDNGGEHKRIITGSADNTARIWDVESEKPLVTLAGHTAAVVSVAFAPDGLRVLTGSQDYLAILWDPVTGKEILTLKAHSQEVTSVAFSPDGSSVLTGSRDGRAIV